MMQMTTKELKLIGGRTSFVDSNNYNQLAEMKWWCGGVNKHRYAYTIINSKVVLLHRFLMTPQKDFEVDHINHNTLDNRKENLRIVTRSQNMMNSSLRKDSKTGFKGVTFKKSHNLYAARITLNKKEHFLGYFKTPEDAYKERQRATIVLHKEYGYTP